jgi:hypothetical protein
MDKAPLTEEYTYNEILRGNKVTEKSVAQQSSIKNKQSRILLGKIKDKMKLRESSPKRLLKGAGRSALPNQ